MSHGDDKTVSWRGNVPSVSQNNLWIPVENAGNFQAICVTLPRQQGHVPLRKHHPRETNPFFISKKTGFTIKKIELEKITLNQLLGPEKTKFYSKLALTTKLSSLAQFV